MPGETAQAYLIPHPCTPRQAGDIYQTRDAPLPLVTKSAGVGVVFHDLALLKGHALLKPSAFRAAKRDARSCKQLSIIEIGDCLVRR